MAFDIKALQEKGQHVHELGSGRGPGRYELHKGWEGPRKASALHY